MNPNIAVSAMIPMAAHPNATRMRMIPTAVDPNPATVPFPNAANPNKGRIGRNRNNFDLRRRRFARLCHDNFGSRRRLRVNRTVAINDLTFHATGKERQRSGDQDGFNND